jgi:hypothetical protein
MPLTFLIGRRLRHHQFGRPLRRDQLGIHHANSAENRSNL